MVAVVRVASPFIAVIEHCADTTGTTAVIATGTTGTTAGRTATGTTTGTATACTASDKVEGRAFLNVCCDNGVAAGVAADTICHTCIAAASTPQVNLIGCIERSSPRRSGIVSVIGFEGLVGRTNILFIDVEENLFVGAVKLFHVVAMILDSIAPEPLPDFLRVRIIGP